MRGFRWVEHLPFTVINEECWTFFQTSNLLTTLKLQNWCVRYSPGLPEGIVIPITSIYVITVPNTRVPHRPMSSLIKVTLKCHSIDWRVKTLYTSRTYVQQIVHNHWDNKEKFDLSSERTENNGCFLCFLILEKLKNLFSHS